MIWVKAGEGSYHMLIDRSYICGVRLDIEDHQMDASRDPPPDKRCKNCMRMIDHIHHRAHIHKDHLIDKVTYRYGKWPMIFTRKLVICEDFGKIEKVFTNVWIQYSGEVNDNPIRGSIAVYPSNKHGHPDTEYPEIIRIKYGRYYKFE